MLVGEMCVCRRGPTVEGRGVSRFRPLGVFPSPAVTLPALGPSLRGRRGPHPRSRHAHAREDGNERGGGYGAGAPVAPRMRARR